MIKGIILDLDGTVYMGDREVPGAGRFVGRMSQRGVRCLFVTNRANRTPEVICDHLREYGIPCTPSDVLTSAQATAAVLEKGTVYCVGEDGLRKALREAGHTLVGGGERADYVVVGFDRGFTYDKLAEACALIHAGARFIATNPDTALKTPDGIAPGTGSIVAAVAAGSGHTPTVIGKPERRIVDIALRRLDLSPNEVLMVGDNLDTDIPAGRAAGVPTALILTGVSTRDDIRNARVRPDHVVDTFEELDAIVLDGGA